MNDKERLDFIGRMTTPDIIVMRDLSTGNVTDISLRHHDMDEYETEIHPDGTATLKWSKDIILSRDLTQEA